MWPSLRRLSVMPLQPCWASPQGFRKTDPRTEQCTPCPKGCRPTTKDRRPNENLATYLDYHKTRCGKEKSHRRHYRAVRKERLSYPFHEDAGDFQTPGRTVLCRARQSAFLQFAHRFHVQRSHCCVGIGEGKCHCRLARTDGRHQSSRCKRRFHP